jgi:hypothetical protein
MQGIPTTSAALRRDIGTDVGRCRADAPNQRGRGRSRRCGGERSIRFLHRFMLKVFEKGGSSGRDIGGIEFSTPSPVLIHVARPLAE